MDENTVRLWLKDHQDAAEKLVQQQAEAFQLQLDTLRNIPDKWIFAITEYFSLLNTSADQHLRIMEFNLEGATAEWFRWMSRNGLITTWVRFEESVKNRFGPSKYEDPRGALSKLLQLGTVEDYQQEFEKLINRVTDIPDSLLISFYISGLKLNLQHELLVSRPTTLGDALFLAQALLVVKGPLDAGEDTLLSLRNEDPNFKIKEKAVEYVRTLNAAPLEVVFAGPIDEVHGKFVKFSEDKGCVEKVLSATELLEGGNSHLAYSSYHLEGMVIFEGVKNVTPWAADGGRRKRVKCYIQGSERRKKKKVYRPKNRQERRSENRKSLQQSSILKPLATWGKDDDIATLVKSILDGSALGSFGQCGGDFLEEGAMGNSNIKQCIRKVADEHFMAAVKVLSSLGVALYCDDTTKASEAKHPYKPPPSMPSITFSEPPLVAEIDSVFCCIKSFPKGTSCGRDDLRAQHILNALCGEGSATATNLLKVITSVVNLWLAGRCPPILAEFVASAPLMPLLKPDNGIRPIAVGTIWRRLVSKVSMKGVGKEMSKVLSEYHNDGSLTMLTMDLSNAFNLVDRSALLHEQSDPLGPLLFARILHQLLHKIKDSCKLLHAWYLDDGTVIGDSEEVARVLDIIKLREGLFLVDIQRPSLGVKLLVGAVSRDASFICGLAMRRAVNAVDLMSLLP
ncbi:putative reverse transcriptase domain-containing protein [Tanacetum coccineum]